MSERVSFNERMRQRAQLRPDDVASKVPRGFEIVEALPRTAMFTIRRSALVEERTRSDEQHTDARR